tara:strand:- start:299 stop:487 length:189 start_codon:yes stop_codon:yes gene_type:complete
MTANNEIRNEQTKNEWHLFIDPDSADRRWLNPIGAMTKMTPTAARISVFNILAAKQPFPSFQ